MGIQYSLVYLRELFVHRDSALKGVRWDALISQIYYHRGTESERAEERIDGRRGQWEKGVERERDRERYCRRRREKEIVKSRHTAAASIDVRKLFKQIIANTPADQFYGQIRFTVQR